MKTISKKTLLITCMVCLAASISLVIAASPLVVNFGPVTVTAKPADVIIVSATWNTIDGSIVGDGQSVTFSSIPAMLEDSTATVTIVVENRGSVTATISATVSGQGSVLAFAPTSAPTTVAGNSDATFTFTVTAVEAGTVTPSISITWA